MSYNFLAIMSGRVNYFFCIIEEVNFLPMVSPVLGTKYLQVVQATLSSFFLCSHTGGHAGSFFLAYLFSVLTHKVLFKQQ